jgi:hypothetical protein
MQGLSDESVATDGNYIYRSLRIFVVFDNANSALTVRICRRQRDHISRYLITSTIPFIETDIRMP